MLTGCTTYRFHIKGQDGNSGKKGFMSNSGKKDSALSTAKALPAANAGYVASYDGWVIPEYTVGSLNSFPDLITARERFKRRRHDVEYYYKKMGKIETRFKAYLWDPPVLLVDLLGGILRWPFVAVADYKYNRNPVYKAKVDKLEEENDALEKSRQDNLKARLQAYISTDLKQEPQKPGKVTLLAVEPKPAAEISPNVNEVAPKIEPVAVLEPAAPQALVAPPVIKEEVVNQPVAVALPAAQEEVAPQPAVSAPSIIKAEPLIAPVSETTPVIPQVPEVVPSAAVVEPVVEIKPVVKPVLVPPVAVIVATPLRGLSPLTVKFSGQKSYSKSGRIVSYDWNFGDGDTSSKKSPLNTYWSTTYGTRPFTVTLTVKDEAGNTSSASTVIEVVTR